MKLRMFQWLRLPAALATANALYGWGSLTLLDDLGPVAEHSAQREAALTWTYMQGGRRLIEATGVQAAAIAHAEDAPDESVALLEAAEAWTQLADDIEWAAEKTASRHTRAAGVARQLGKVT